MRACVADIFRVGNGYLLFKHKIDVDLGKLLVFGTARDAHRIDEDVRALLGVEKSEVVVVAVHSDKVAGVI